MRTLYESILKSTSSHIKDIPKIIKTTELYEQGFPEFEDEFDGWIWICPDILERYEDKIYKLTKRKKTYCGFWVEVIPAKIGKYEENAYDAFSCTIYAITDRTKNTPWMGAGDLVSFTCERDWKKVYEMFQLFGLNMDEMLDDFIKLGDNYILDKVYPKLIKKYGK